MMNNTCLPVNTLASHYQARVEHQLNICLPSVTQQPIRLHEAMHYAVFSGGKRIRPLLVYATGLFFDTDPCLLDIPALSVELIHTYSLIHDDLPAMDNADFRRGKTSCHKQYGEATAILAGDALQSLAFEILARSNNSAMVAVLSKACGTFGMAGGQQLDLERNNQSAHHPVQQINDLKTAALFRASVELGILASHCKNPTIIDPLVRLATLFGLLFQMQDDQLDEGIAASQSLTDYFDEISTILKILPGNTTYLTNFYETIKYRIE